MKFIEVYSIDDKEKLLNLGYKLIKTSDIQGGLKFTFINDNRKLQFDNMKITYTNTMQF